MAIEKKTIGDLKGYKFFVPSYQRGYRWTEFEVKALLDDVSEFSTEGDKKYCIQPLIVKKREDGSFEVVDGQQRLTTIYIFMKIASEEIRSAVPPFELIYETRENSGSFLKNLSEYTYSDDSNIDYYHMGRAYENMNQWLESQSDKSVSIQKLNTKIRESVFFIWYELPKDSDAIAMFTKVNLGKIPLTNAELIKALILNKDNFDADVRKRQTEISIAWDKIEQGLRDDSFWFFLNEKEHSGTRIDMLFNLLAHEYNKKLNAPISFSQNFFPFLVFSQYLNCAKGQEAELVNAIWGDVEKLYAEFRDWYYDLNKYHLTGYLIAIGTSISEISLLTRGKRKSAVAKALLDKAKTNYNDLETLAADTPTHKKRIRRLLLLFNIATLVCKSEKQYRFPFDIYKRGQWDIEHIHASADETDDADDSLSNLTLLDSQTNRSYKDKTFAEKRKIIIERESHGLFVPLCTKNVFTKIYSSKLDDMSLWNAQDKIDYVSAIKANT